jgi:deoxyribodipyrimidine photo-lyase
MNQSRILTLKDQAFVGDAVVYVMSRDQRVHDNHALLVAQSEANKHKVPLYVLFNIKIVQNRAREHYDFMLTGLEEVAAELSAMGISFVLKAAEADIAVIDLLSEVNAGSVYFDFNPLSGSRVLAKKIANHFKGGSYVVDTHNIIPTWVASDKQEFAAHTMRRKVHLNLEKYMLEPNKMILHVFTPSLSVTCISFDEARDFISTIPARNISLSAVPGEKAALKHLFHFIKNGLGTYAIDRNDIANNHQSGLSPYLHFGQVSSLRVALEVMIHVDRRPLLFEEVRLASASDVPTEQDGMNALFEEMIVRKELSDNFCFYQPKYKSLKGGPDWAQQSLELHKSDTREFIYSRKQWENAATHDLSWNAAQNELRKSGKIHGYMRMYWAKKILEWSDTPENALANCVYLNDAYSIDGGDPNGYVGILWSIVGLHDRPWFERPIFGKIRYMNESGLMKKYDVAFYQHTWN